MELHERIFELALTRSFFIPSNEPYGTVSGFYDYGPVGKLIKSKIEDLWRRRFIRDNGFHEVETSIITPEIVLQASGHASNFADPVVECRVCKARLRGDTLIEEKLKSKGDKHGARWDGKLDTIDHVVKEEGITCPKCKGELSPAKMFNLMFKTGIGGEQETAYARPETAQGIFTAFPRLFRNHGAKLPLAIGQIGKSFRNEISPRKGLVRMREFTQMELEYFFDPQQQSVSGFEMVSGFEIRFGIDDKIVVKTAQEAVKEGIAANEIMAWFLVKEWEFYKAVGIDENRMWMRVLPKEEAPHYSKGNIDMEVETSYGNIETIGNAYRTDFDVGAHARFSKKDLSVFVQESNKRIIPHVFEVSMGVDRLFFCMLEQCFREKDSGTGNPKPETGNATKTGNREQETGNGKDWEWFDFPPAIAPYEVAVFPLMKKDGLAEKAEELAKMLRAEFDVFHQEGGSLGKRYARADEIGVPYALTVDYDTLKDSTVTIRYRNDGKQERIKIEECVAKVKENISKNRVTL